MREGLTVTFVCLVGFVWTLTDAYGGAPGWTQQDPVVTFSPHDPNGEHIPPNDTDYDGEKSKVIYSGHKTDNTMNVYTYSHEIDKDPDATEIGKTVSGSWQKSWTRTSGSEPALFTLSWAGNTAAETCWAWTSADTDSDWANAQLKGKVQVASTLTDNDDDKWAVASQKEVYLLPDDPNPNVKWSLSTQAAIAIASGLPVPAWDFLAGFDMQVDYRSSTVRTQDGYELSNSVNRNSQAQDVIYGANCTAAVSHSSQTHVSYGSNCTWWVDPEAYSRAKLTSTTTLFTLACDSVPGE